jgi:hypothetical protein
MWILKRGKQKYLNWIQKPDIQLTVWHILVCKTLQEISSDQQVPRQPWIHNKIQRFKSSHIKTNNYRNPSSFIELD